MKSKMLRETLDDFPSSYDPVRLINQLADRLQVVSDYGLAKALGLPPPTISKIRNHRANVTAGVLLRMHDVTHIPVDTLRTWMGLEAFSLSEKGPAP